MGSLILPDAMLAAQPEETASAAPPATESAAGLELLIGPEPDRTVVTLVGELTMSTACHLGRVLTELVDQGHRFLVLDARALKSCDGAGWTLLLGIRWRLLAVSGHLRLIGLTPRLLRSCLQLELAEVFGLDSPS
ncbi:hypothetical protein GCM10010156_30460 [Planobispora rosea]|uniref:STAS domain-containing protein n=1 Tax=Planobispora rosea TaxID=35762 RepID=A0A8J3S145_PLARO|nr:STAS domain-containing protein [Planobispora rosea]GGS69599.1 hypothetical protein GCM10010156_30460 [Planobispora rosea]GIH83154.1 hypothetical protein Pro02_15620 [Planobispora rosea]